LCRKFSYLTGCWRFGLGGKTGFNAALATLNLVRAEDLGMPQGQEPHVFSMASWKQCHFNERLLDVFMEKFALDPTWVKNHACYDELRTYGAIAA